MEDKEIQEILDRYLSGTATEQQKAILELWYIGLEVKDRPILQESIRDNQLEDIWAGLPVHKKQRNLYPWAWASAAALLVVCSCLWLFLSDHAHPGGIPVTKIIPGSERATLLLAGGKQLELDKASLGRVAMQGGSEVLKDDSARVSYRLVKTAITKSKRQVLYNVLKTPTGGEYSIILPDGTYARLNAASSLKFPVSFAVKERVVEVSGEVYFEVKKNPLQPFRVLSGKQQLEVLGTHFDVKAYPDDDAVSTTLLEGSVRIAGPGGNKMLKPGQRARLTGNQLYVQNVNVNSAASWINGEFALKNEDFKSTMREIERWYDVKVIYDGTAPDSLKLGGWISRRKPITEVIKIMETTGLVKFRISGREVHVSR